MKQPKSACLSGVCLFLAVGSFIGCASSNNQTGYGSSDDQGYPAVPAGQPTRATTGPSSEPSTLARPIGYLNGQPIRADQLQTSLVEIGGGQVLFEFVLDKQISDELRRRSMTVTDEQVEKEQRLLLQNLDADSNQAQRLLNELKDRRGLGPSRYRQLLYRNAALRALVASQVQVSELALRQEYEIYYGPRYEIRLITVDTLSSAQDVLRRLRSGETFPDVAIKLSSDASRQQGGLLSPFSSEDQSYPKAIRDELPSMRVGQVSNPISLESGFAVIRLERKIEGIKPSMDDVKKQLTESVRLRIERVLMDQLVRSMMDKTQLTLTNDVWQRAWDNQQKRFGPPSR